MEATHARAVKGAQFEAVAVLPNLPDDVGVAVNLTAHDVRSPTLADPCGALLAEIGCDELQGFLIGRPMSRSDLLNYVAGLPGGAGARHAPWQRRQVA